MSYMLEQVIRIKYKSSTNVIIFYIAAEAVPKELVSQLAPRGRMV